MNEPVTQAYPLQWPAGWIREAEPITSRFGTNGPYGKKPTIMGATEKIIYEMQLFGGQDLIVSTNLKYKQNGLPYANQKEPQDKGVAVYFNYDGGQKVIACDSFNKIGCNLWAIAKTIEAMRGIDRWGCSQIMAKAFTGFVALPEARKLEWWEILELPDPNVCGLVVKDKFHELAKKYHPDTPGGSEQKFQEINAAYQTYKTRHDGRK